MSTREEEKDVLTAIFGDDFSEESSNSWVIKLTGGVGTVNFNLPEKYPVSDPPVVVVSFDSEVQKKHPLLKQGITDGIVDSLEWNAGTVCVFDWITEIQSRLNDLISVDQSEDDGYSNYLEEDIPNQEDAEYVHDVFLQKLLAEEHANQRRKPVDLHSSVPFTEKKSTFQGHCAEISSKADVTAALAQLYQDRKFRTAGHNQYAYRFRDEQGNLHADNCDDGEAGAGKKLAELLELTGVENVLVIVSRWCGGKMGPSRFKAIATAGSDILTQMGLRKPSKPQKK